MYSIHASTRLVGAVLATAVIVACAGSAPGTMSEPYTSPASADTLSKLGVTTWGVTTEGQSTHATGYDSTNAPVVSVTQTTTPADATTSQMRIEVSGSRGAAFMTSRITSRPDPDDSARQAVDVELTQNTFPDNPAALDVMDHLQADLHARTPELSRTSGADRGPLVSGTELGDGTSLTQSLELERIPLTTDTCVNLTVPCAIAAGGALYTGYKAASSCYTLYQTSKLALNCVKASAVTWVGPAICAAVAAEVLPPQAVACGGGLIATYGGGVIAKNECTKSCSGGAGTEPGPG